MPKLTDAYAELPMMPSCTSCGNCCGPVTATRRELEHIKRYVDKNNVQWLPREDDVLRCGFLRGGPVVDGDSHTGDHPCAIYPVRPWVCRSYGTNVHLQCAFFPEDAELGPAVSSEEATRRGLGAVGDRLLGEVFEKGFWQRVMGVLPGFSQERFRALREVTPVFGKSSTEQVRAGAAALRKRGLA